MGAREAGGGGLVWVVKRVDREGRAHCVLFSSSCVFVSSLGYLVVNLGYALGILETFVAPAFLVFLFPLFSGLPSP